MPAVSVIIPVFNRAAMLGRTLATVAEQTFRDFEVVIVDDASSDDPAPAIEAARAGGLDINYIKFLKNRGVSAARNAGIEAATGDFIAFLDSDDLWMPEKLQRQVDFALTLPDREAVFCLTRTRVRDETGGETIRPAADPVGEMCDAERLDQKVGGAMADGIHRLADRTAVGQGQHDGKTLGGFRDHSGRVAVERKIDDRDIGLAGRRQTREFLA